MTRIRSERISAGIAAQAKQPIVLIVDQFPLVGELDGRGTFLGATVCITRCLCIVGHSIIASFLREQSKNQKGDDKRQTSSHMTLNV